MKDKNISLTDSPKLNPKTQCWGKKKYPIKRRALEDAHDLAEKHPEFVFTLYECPHCHNFHVGRVKK